MHTGKQAAGRTTVKTGENAACSKLEQRAIWHFPNSFASVKLGWAGMGKTSMGLAACVSACKMTRWKE